MKEQVILFWSYYKHDASCYIWIKGKTYIQKELSYGDKP